MIPGLSKAYPTVKLSSDSGLVPIGPTNVPTASEVPLRAVRNVTYLISTKNSDFAVRYDCFGCQETFPGVHATSHASRSFIRSIETINQQHSYIKHRSGFYFSKLQDTFSTPNLQDLFLRFLDSRELEASF